MGPSGAGDDVLTSSMRRHKGGAFSASYGFGSLGWTSSFAGFIARVGASRLAARTDSTLRWGVYCPLSRQSRARPPHFH
jgi:hypothetical protein